MTLRRKMVLQIAATIVGLLLTIGASLWGLNGLRQDYGLALDGYRELRQLFEVGSHLATAETLLTSSRPDRAAAAAEVERAADKFALTTDPPTAPSDALTPGRVAGDAKGVGEVASALRIAVIQLHTAPEQDLESDTLRADEQEVSVALGRVGALASQIRQTIEASRINALHKRHETMLAMGVVSAVAVLWAVLLGIWQYRGVVTPLNLLGNGVRRVAAAEFTGRVEDRGAEEFAALAREFNRMAGELHGFYTQLEQKVAQKSSELVRSERLASVGFLAAGVAHEINNPLGIISGYAELSLDRLRTAARLVNAGNMQQANGAATELADTVDTDPELVRSLQVICDEAFRCKDITSKLLSLARSGDEGRSHIALDRVANEVAGIVGGLRDYRDRQVRVEATSDRPLTVLANGVEMKQVVLNLTLNALEALPNDDGEVHIAVRRVDRMVEMTVTDDGRGMNAETLARVFEPFFTEKRGARPGGTGLGLSITHAIINEHGGRIRAESDGLGHGSRFVVELPAADALENVSSPAARSDA